MQILNDKRDSDHKVKIMDYNDLSNVNDLDELFEDTDAVIFSLVRSINPRISHWVCLLKKDKTYEYYNSYGFDIYKDLQIAILDNKNYLPNLLSEKLNQGYTINFNDKQLQQFNAKVNTCGAHVINRILFDKYTNNQYTAMILGFCQQKNLTPDELVIIMISSYLLKLA